MNSNQFYLLECIAHFIDQGFSIDDIMMLCQSVDQNHLCDSIQDSLCQGLSLEDALLQSSLPDIFKEYFSFFKNDFSLSIALVKSVQICKKREEMKKTLLKKLSYPLFMIVFLMIFSIFIVAFLLPQVEMLFIEFNIERSLFIQIIFPLFKIGPCFIFLLICSFLLLISFVVFAIKKQRFQMIDFFIQRTHLISQFVKKYYSIKFAIYYNELIQNYYDTNTIVEILYNRIHDSDIKMIVYELYHQLLDGHMLSEVIDEFDYFEDKFKQFFKILMSDQLHKKSLDDYIDLSVQKLETQISNFIKIFIPLVYGFVACFVIFVYISIIIPMMNVVSEL